MAEAVTQEATLDQQQLSHTQPLVALSPKCNNITKISRTDLVVAT